MGYEELLTYYPGKDLAQGHIFLVDKPLGWTSFNVVGKVRHLLRRYLGLRSIKVGHAGTLDPLATGLMVVCVGRATKLAGTLTGEDKRYLATFTLGTTTPSYDRETAVDAEYSVEHITPEAIIRVAESFLGVYQQVPPLFSAKRVEGKRAYEVARKGREVELLPVPVTIKQFSVLGIEMPNVEADVECSKGTYIRALARDFGQRLGCGAHLNALRRTASGGFSLQDAMTPEGLEQFLKLVGEGQPKLG